jgi:hypothetical protein
MISREAAAAICDEAACETDSESARYEMFRARDAIRALPAMQPKVKPLVWIEDGDGFCAKGANRTYAVFRLALDRSTWGAVGVKHTSQDKASVMAACQSDHDAQILAALFPAVQPDAAAIKSAAFEIAVIMELHAATGSTTKAKAEDIERGIRALIDNTGKEVMPSDRPVRVRPTDIGPGDQAVAGAAHPPAVPFGAQPGTKIVFHGIGGYEAENEKARSVLQVGSTYTLIELDVGGWRSSLSIKEAPGVWFNTVMFQPEAVAGAAPVTLTPMVALDADKIAAGLAAQYEPWPEGLIHLTNTRRFHVDCATEGCGRRVSTRFEGSDYCEPCGRKVALAQKGGA